MLINSSFMTSGLAITGTNRVGKTHALFLPDEVQGNCIVVCDPKNMELENTASQDNILYLTAPTQGVSYEP